jgi:hypothetical protein
MTAAFIGVGSPGLGILAPVPGSCEPDPIPPTPPASGYLGALGEPSPPLL